MATTKKTAVNSTNLSNSGRIGEPLQNASASATRITTADTAALTSVGMATLYLCLIGPDRHGGGLFRPLRPRAQAALEVACRIAVEQMADEAAVEVGGAEGPIGDREGQVHVHFHHQPRIVVGGVMAPQRVDERAVLDEPAFVQVAAEMHELVDQIHAGGDAHEQPADIRREDEAESGGGRYRHQGEHDQCIGREYRHAPILVVAEAHFLVAEELMMIECVP